MAEASSSSSTPAAATGNPAAHAVLFASEAIAPGLSHVLRGDLANGAGYGLAGLFATLVFGTPGRVLVGAASFVKSASGTDLLSLVRPPRQG
ncbi:MAG TPA: DUF6072 family protein [Acidimicrobiales bacterium]|jgi:hypothetical protein